MRTTLSRFLSYLLLAALTTATRASGADAVRQIDHIMIDVPEPEQAFRLFSEKLGFAVAWRFRDYGTFASGGVSTGSINLELIHRPTNPLGLAGIAFEPNSIPEAVAALDARGLQHTPPAPFYQKDKSGQDHLAWTNMGISLPPTAASLFFCKYTLDVEARRARLKQDLQNRDGGPLGIESAIELVIGVRDLAAAQHAWAALLGRPQSETEPTWRLGSGPAIRLVRSDQDRLTTLRIKVKSLDRCRAALIEEKLLGSDTVSEVSLQRSRVGGADLRFVE